MGCVRDISVFGLIISGIGCIITIIDGKSGKLRSIYPCIRIYIIFYIKSKNQDKTGRNEIDCKNPEKKAFRAGKIRTKQDEFSSVQVPTMKPVD